MNLNLVVSHPKGVVCVFCSACIPLPLSFLDQKRWERFGHLHLGLLTVRCKGCGKEAQYMTGEIIAMPAAAAGA